MPKNKHNETQTYAQERQAYAQERREDERRRRAENKRTGRVSTPDGEGLVLGREARTNTNGGPGCYQWRVKLDDGRIRHYSAASLTEIKTPA